MKEAEAARDRRISLRAQKKAFVEAYIEKFGNVCYICGEPPNGKTLRLDHDHACASCGDEHAYGGTAGGCISCFRGLLCNHCNLGLGLFRDDPQLLMTAAAYLQMQPMATV